MLLAVILAGIPGALKGQTRDSGTDYSHRMPVAAIADAARGSKLPLTDSSMEQDTSLRKYLRFEDPGALSCLVTWFPSVFIANGLELKNFIRSSGFRRIRNTYGDRRAVDAIYVRAMSLTNNNTAVALFLAAIACFDHRIVGIRNPFFLLYFPLSNESAEEFSRRVRNLPVKLYGDTPAGPTGDRDKLQHFFGSAFIAYISESGGSADRVGDFIEQSEEAAIIGGINDDRDRRANGQGQRFALALFNNNLQYPSVYLKPAPPAGRQE